MIGLRPVDKDDPRASYVVTSRSRGFGKEVQRRLLLGSFVLSAG